MSLYDVGMSSMFAQDCYALANLSALIDRPAAQTAKLRARGDGMASLIKQHLWDDATGNFVNKWSANASFYPRITPTSFYALQAHAASDAQADRMATEWLLNESRFCLTRDGSYDGNSETCYWGLPSIQASDPAFPPLGYWRGYIWGPMAQLTFWSLQEYDHVPAIRTARKSLCKQLSGLMMSQFNAHRHICENYNVRCISAPRPSFVLVVLTSSSRPASAAGSLIRRRIRAAGTAREVSFTIGARSPD